jgi:hypothetical protein
LGDNTTITTFDGSGNGGGGSLGDLLERVVLIDLPPPPKSEWPVLWSSVGGFYKGGSGEAKLSNDSETLTIAFDEEIDISGYSKLRVIWGAWGVVTQYFELEVDGTDIGSYALANAGIADFENDPTWGAAFNALKPSGSNAFFDTDSAISATRSLGGATEIEEIKISSNGSWGAKIGNANLVVKLIP